MPRPSIPREKAAVLLLATAMLKCGLMPAINEPEEAGVSGEDGAGGVDGACVGQVIVGEQRPVALDSSRSCDYQIPNLAQQNLDYVVIQTSVGAQGGPLLLSRVADAGGCSQRDGWYYDPPFVAGGPPPTTISLCPKSCDSLSGTPGGRMQISIGCATAPAS